MIAAIEACTATRVEAIVGKPSEYTIEAILDRLGLPAGRCMMTGDRLETDVAMGLNAGMDASLVLTGATGEAALIASPIQPTYVLRKLGDLLPEPLIS
jgi:ribonucleotide monophosphatase NagD (HAD superfamily)